MYGIIILQKGIKKRKEENKMEKKVSVNENNLVSLIKILAADMDCNYCPFSANCTVETSPENCENVLAKMLGFELKDEKTKWVEKITEKILFDNRCSFYQQERIIVCVCRYDNNKIAVGITRCHDEDEFDIRVGRAIAYARAKKWFLPKGL